MRRLHNDANVLALGERLVPEGELVPMLRVWLTTPFEGGRHVRRLQQIDATTAERRAWNRRAEARADAWRSGAPGKPAEC